MSNELLMELFEYYDFYSLFYSFNSLNSRIDNILYHCQVYVDFDKVNPIDFSDFLALTLPKINPKNIRSLNASKTHQITVLADDKSLVHFTYIQSLSLDTIGSSVIKQMVSRIHFSRLERVVLNKCTYSDIWPRFTHFLDSNRYQFLRTYKDLNNMIEKVTSISLIEHVTIRETNLYAFLNFLNQSTYLKYIKTTLDFDSDFPAPVFLSPIPCYHALTYLHLDIRCNYKDCTETMTYLFKCTPRISHLKVKATGLFYHPGVCDPMFWETVLSKYLEELKGLYLHALSYYYYNDVYISPRWKFLLDKEKVIEQIEKSNYWSSHQWKITFKSTMAISDKPYRIEFNVR